MASCAPLPLNVLHGLQKAGIDLAEVAARAHLAVDDLKKPLSEEQADRFFTVAYDSHRRSRRAALPLGMQMRPELFGVVGFSAMTCPDFGAALARIVRYTALASACDLELVQDAREAEVRMHYDGPQRPYSRCRMDIQMGALLSFGRLFTEQPITPVRLTLRGERPVLPRPLRRSVLVPGAVRAAARCHRVPPRRPRPAAGQRQPAGHRPVRRCRRTRPARAAHAPQHDARPCATRCARCCAASCPPSSRWPAGCASASAPCSGGWRGRARSSPRLLDDVRLEMARHHLAAGRASLTEIAYLLGFVDPNSFFRSFKRWTGQTPDVYRHGAARRPASPQASSAAT